MGGTAVLTVGESGGSVSLGRAKKWGPGVSPPLATTLRVKYTGRLVEAAEPK